VPFRVAEVEEQEVRFLFLQSVGVGAKRDLGTRVAELTRDPGDALVGGEGEARERMPSIVEAERANAFFLGLPSKAVPAPADVSLVQQTARLGAEDEGRWLLPLPP